MSQGNLVVRLRTPSKHADDWARASSRSEVLHAVGTPSAGYELATSKSKLMAADNDKSKVRALGLNYYLVQDWNAAWGGNFLWCGTNQEGSDAQRIVPGFNQAVLFVPGSSAWHAVEVVQKEPSATAQRFSFSTWLRIHANSASHK
eukprot:6187406-Pleurochrysis_carterae.AAC.3